MISAPVWFVILLTVCIAGPYILGVRPRTQRHWLYIAITVALLAWLLPLMASLRAASFADQAGTAGAARPRNVRLMPKA